MGTLVLSPLGSSQVLCSFRKNPSKTQKSGHIFVCMFERERERERVYVLLLFYCFWYHYMHSVALYLILLGAATRLELVSLVTFFKHCHSIVTSPFTSYYFSMTSLRAFVGMSLVLCQKMWTVLRNNLIEDGSHKT